MKANEKRYTLKDNPMFVSVMEDRKVAKKVLERALGRRVARIGFMATEHRQDLGPSGASIRMDVYLEDADDVVYDIEMQTYTERDLGMRLRRYQSTIDSQSLKPSSREKSLKRSFIIFICTFDPFSMGLPKYTFGAGCIERPGFVLDTGASWIVLNAKAWREEKDEKLSSLLRYIAGEGEADDKLIAEIARQVDAYNEDEEWRNSDMVSLWEKATGEGRAEGKAEAEAKYKKREDLGVLMNERGRASEYFQALQDEELMERLLSEFGLEESQADQA